MLITIILIIILIFSAILHEYAHGWMAHKLGDDTAERAGRLTLNPIKHLDPIGSILVPLILIVTKANFFIAWAKPVPYNPNNLRDKKYGELKVAAAGPITNFILAIIFGLIVRFVTLGPDVTNNMATNFLSGNNDALLAMTSGSITNSIVMIAMLACLINLMLGLFNLIPIPPLDGSKVLAGILPYSFRQLMYRIEQYGFIILMLLIIGGAFSFIFNIAISAFLLLTGLG